MILEYIDPIVPNESLDMIYEDQKSYVDDDLSLNEVVEYFKKDIFIENVLDEFLEDFFTDEGDENVEEFPTMKKNKVRLSHLMKLFLIFFWYFHILELIF